MYRNPLVLLRNVLKGVGHENSDVRSSALCTLNKLLLEYKVNTGVINICVCMDIIKKSLLYSAEVWMVKIFDKFGLGKF